MATFIITVPDSLVPAVVGGLREMHPDFTGTDLQLGKKAIYDVLKEAYSRYRLHNDNVEVRQAVDDAAVAAQQAYEDAQQTRKDAEATTLANVEADFTAS